MLVAYLIDVEYLISYFGWFLRVIISIRGIQVIRVIRAMRVIGVIEVITYI